MNLPDRSHCSFVVLAVKDWRSLARLTSINDHVILVPVRCAAFHQLATLTRATSH